ncbi:hypothetical protein H5410_031785 [Solanum commersonii]|uniref:Uncharacterized protein n=1 Tax=Solanum commersonii TaxID=4109 RepID=A0A9J5YKZ3_SOLCO|nr:hypothetical protein H5410_031785 [Solanum commersonii]
MTESKDNIEFYLRYYVGDKGKFGHEFLEFKLRRTMITISLNRIAGKSLRFSLMDVHTSKDPEGHHIFYYLLHIIIYMLLLSAISSINFKLIVG